jgi:hypothetical protein
MKKVLKRVLVGVMATVTALSTVVFSGCKTDKANGQASVPSFNITPDEDYGISLTSAVIAEDEYETYGVTAEAESAYTITATYKESYVTYPEMDWSVEFVNPTSDFATDKVVTDYITVTPTEDGALTAVVTALQAFGEPIKVIGTNRFTPTVSASVVCDYVAYVEDISVTFSSVSSSDVYVDLTGVLDSYSNQPFPSGLGRTNIVGENEMSDSFVGLRRLQISPLTYTTGTVNSSIDEALYSFKLGCYTFGDAFLLGFVDKGFTLREGYSYSGSSNTVYRVSLSFDEDFCIGLPFIDFFVKEQRNLVLQTWEYLRGYRLEEPENYDDGALYYSYMEFMASSFHYPRLDGSPCMGETWGEIGLKDASGIRYYKFEINYPSDWFDVEATAINTDVTSIVFGG